MSDPAAAQPSTADSVRECYVWMEQMERYCANCEADAAVADKAGNGALASEFLAGAAAWRFRADALKRAGDVLNAILPVEGKVRDVVRAYRTKEKARAPAKDAAA